MIIYPVHRWKKEIEALKLKLRVSFTLNLIFGGLILYGWWT